MRYHITPKRHLVGKALKRFYRDLLGWQNLPILWQERPTVTITKKEVNGDIYTYMSIGVRR